MLSSFTPTSTRNSRVMITGGDGVDATEIVSRANQKFFMVGRESILRRASGRHAETGKRVCILPREPIPEQLARFENVGHRLKICFTSTSGAAGVERHKLGESLSALSSNPCPHAARAVQGSGEIAARRMNRLARRFRISVGNRDYHHLSHFEIDGAKRISQHLSRSHQKIRSQRLVTIHFG
jgi:hypothetical protein